MLGENVQRMKAPAEMKPPVMQTGRHPNLFVRALAMGPAMVRNIHTDRHRKVILENRGQPLSELSENPTFRIFAKTKSHDTFVSNVYFFEMGKSSKFSICIFTMK